jgi:hypothetical protein
MRVALPTTTSLGKVDMARDKEDSHTKALIPQFVKSMNGNFVPDGGQFRTNPSPWPLE